MNLSIWINRTILILKTVLTVIKIWVVIVPYNCAEIKSKQSLCICIKHKTRGSYVQQYYIHVLHAHINRQFDANKTCYPNDIRDFKKSLLISQCYFFFLELCQIEKKYCTCIKYLLFAIKVYSTEKLIAASLQSNSMLMTR